VRGSCYGTGREEPVALQGASSGRGRTGVAKLGFAWEAAHVRIFRGEGELSTALIELCTTPAVTNATLIVQVPCASTWLNPC
jgi:hypothetical protein